MAGDAAVGEDEVLFFDFDQYVEGSADLGHFDAFFADGGDGFFADLVEDGDLGRSEIRWDFGWSGRKVVLHKCNCCLTNTIHAL